LRTLQFSPDGLALHTTEQGKRRTHCLHADWTGTLPHHEPLTRLRGVCRGHELEIQREAGWDSEEISYEESDSTTDGESDSASDDDTSDDDSSDDASGTGYHKRQGATDGREGGALVGFLSFPGFRLFASAFDDQGQRGAVLARCERTQANALIVFPQLDPLT
jgi:hypothetical protein